MWVLALACGSLALAACRGTPGRTPGASRNAFVWARTPAAGATSTCPDDAVDFTGDTRVPSGDHVRCSYADAERGQARIEGKVMREQAGALAEGVEGVEVVLVQLAEDGSARAIARTRTDAQGGFSLAARVSAGSFAVRSAGGASPSWQWDGKGPWRQDELVVFVP